MCINTDSDYDAMYKNTVELTKNLMVKYNITIDRVVRHFDASGKPCPNHMMAGNWSKWLQFKRDIAQPIMWKMDLNKNSEFGGEIKVEVKQESKVNIHEVSDWAKEDRDWAVEKNITDGSRPKDYVTREEVWAMIHRSKNI